MEILAQSPGSPLMQLDFDQLDDAVAGTLMPQDSMRNRFPTAMRQRRPCAQHSSLGSRYENLLVV